VDGDGREYCAIIRRWVRCEHCRQVRIERSFERPPAMPAAGREAAAEM
jgi:hypothetical protein